MIIGKKALRVYNTNDTPITKAVMGCAIHNRFDVEVIDATTGEVKRRAQALNVICNQLWARLFTPAAYFNYIHYGVGSGTPTATDISLFSFSGCGTPGREDDTIDWPEEGATFSYRRKIQINEQTAIGLSLSEVGIAYGTEASTLCTHAMLEDMNGNPVVINKTSTDIINIYATVFLHLNKNGYNGIFVSADELFNSTYGPCGFLGYLVGNYFGSSSGVKITRATPPTAALLLPGSVFTAVETSSAQTLTAAYNETNKTIVFTMARASVERGNVNGASIIALFPPYHAYTYGGYSPLRTTHAALVLYVGEAWFPCTTITGEAVGTGDGQTLDFSTCFPYAASATVYVDGVEDMSAVVDGGLNADSYASNLKLGRRLIQIAGYSTEEQIVPVCSASYVSTYGVSYSSATETLYFYNPCYINGIGGFYLYKGYAYASDDMETWTLVADKSSGGGTVSVAPEMQNKRFWKFVLASGTLHSFTLPASFSGNNIHFLSPPAEGAVITVDYTTKTIAKDENHVFDLSVEIQLSEYTE